MSERSKIIFYFSCPNKQLNCSSHERRLTLSEENKLYSEVTIGKYTYQMIAVFPTHGAETFPQKMKRILANHLSDRADKQTCVGTDR